MAALRRGDKVIATARGRSINKLADLQEKGADVLEIDVTDPLDKLREVAAKAVKIHGRVDVLVNQARMRADLSQAKKQDKDLVVIPIEKYEGPALYPLERRVY